MNKRYKTTRRILIFWTLFINLGALFGGACMLIDPSGKFMGMDALLPYFKVLPFSDILFTNLIFSGIMLCFGGVVDLECISGECHLKN